MYTRLPVLMPPDPRRRRLLLGATSAALAPLAACGGGSAVAVNLVAAAPAAIERSLPILALDQGVLDASGSRQFSLRVQRGTVQFRDGVHSATLGYNGAVLGPALRLRSGEKTTIQVRNELDEVTTTHWHGLILPADVDGGPHQAIAPGALWTASFTVANAPSSCWFHPHVHGATGRQVLLGLTGMLIVDDTTASATTLPHTWGVDDLALVLQDKRFTASGQIDTTLSANDREIGYTGEYLLVNGVHGPLWQAPMQWVRLRLLNGCNARILALRLGNAAAMLQIANEGGFLATPVMRTVITLAPGERAEVLVDFSAVASAQDITLYASTVDGGMGMGMGMNMGPRLGLTPGASASEVAALKIRVNLPRQPGAMLSPPTRLVAAPAPVASAGAVVRTFYLEGGMMSDRFTINGRSFDMGRIDWRMRANAVEVWRFVNQTMMAHPMHVHAVRMSMLARGGAAPAAYEQGLRDTFVVESMQTVTVAVQSAAIASASPLMVHCHILEHEDAGMMAQFITV